jgi:hypothetical protein
LRRARKINLSREQTQHLRRTSNWLFIGMLLRHGPESTKGRRWKIMATYRDPVRCFAPLEVVERLLEIRADAGYAPAIYLLSPNDLAAYLDAFGFDVYAFSEAEAVFHFGDYRAPLAPGGDHAHNSLTAH